MLGDLTPWLAALGAPIGTAFLVGGLYAGLKSGVSKRTIELWQEQSAVLETRLDEEKEARLAAEAQRLIDIARIAAAEAQSVECEKRLSALERIVGDTMAKARTPRKRAT